jgi:hypothetical protein
MEPVTIPDWIVAKYKELWWAQPYYLFFGAILGVISAVLGGIIIIVILVVTNFNVLGWTE